MDRIVGSRLCRQIALTSLIAMAPIVIAVGYQAYDWGSTSLQIGEEAAFRATEELIIDVQAVLESAEETLRFMVSAPSVRSGDWTACQAMASQLDRVSNRIAFIGVVDAAGHLICPSIPSTKTVTVADRAWFRNVRETSGFSVGEYAIGRSSGRPSLHLSYPVMRDGQFDGAANLALDVQWLSERLASKKRVTFPTVVYIIDQRGRLMAKSQDTGPAIGARIDVLPQFQQNASDAAQGGSFETTAMDGVQRLVRVEPLIKTSGGTIWSVVGVDKAALTAPAVKSLFWALGLMGLAIVLSLLLLWLTLAQLVVLPIRALDTAAKSLKNGGSHYPVEAAPRGNEVGELSATFNEMAVEVAARDQDRKELARKDVLLREVSHRVKNHLASIASMVHLESRSASAESRQALIATHHRIMAVADLYDLLAQRPASDKVFLCDFVGQVCKQLAAVLGSNGIELNTQFSGDVEIPPERAMAVGFIVNEILTNSVKHAFPSGTGRIEVRVAATQVEAEVRISDDGVGLPESAGSSGIGTSIITAMVNQIEGKLDVQRQGGTSYILSFPAARARDGGARSAAL